MKRLMVIGHILVLNTIIILHFFGQESIMDPVTKKLLDSLDMRAGAIEKEIPRLAETRSPKYFFLKRELDYTLFLMEYHRLVFDEDLSKAEGLTVSRLKDATKRGDNDAIVFYREYRNRIQQEIINQQQRYQQLFAREKNFRKEFYRFINQGDEYSLQRAVRMTDLAIKYAEEKNLKSVVDYSKRYSSYANACLFDYYSTYDLARLTQNENSFHKSFDPLVESDSIELIKEAEQLVDHCYNYAQNTKSILDTNYFAIQRNVVRASLSDYCERKGNNVVLSTLGGQSIIARFDSLNREGVYKWHGNIVVVGHFKPDAKFDNVKKGEAIIEADRKLIEYIRVNRLAKLKKAVDIGPTYIIPFQNGEDYQDFFFNPEMKKFQYMVCYTKIESNYFTREISRLLPLLQFSAEIEML